MMNWKKKYQIFAVIIVTSLCFASSCKRSAGVANVCGGGEDFSCPSGTYCDLGERCGGIDKYGECKYIPDKCPPDNEPVCGCNDVTYTNGCLANAAGMTIAYQGPCIAK